MELVMRSGIGKDGQIIGSATFGAHRISENYSVRAVGVDIKSILPVKLEIGSVKSILNFFNTKWCVKENVLLGI